MIVAGVPVTIKDVSRWVSSIQKDAAREKTPIGVRLQVVPGWGWQVWYGDPGYDSSHQGFWGAGVVGPVMTKAEIRAEAVALIEEAANHAAESNW